MSWWQCYCEIIVVLGSFRLEQIRQRTSFDEFDDLSSFEIFNFWTFNFVILSIELPSGFQFICGLRLPSLRPLSQSALNVYLTKILIFVEYDIRLKFESTAWHPKSFRVANFYFHSLFSTIFKAIVIVSFNGIVCK